MATLLKLSIVICTFLIMGCQSVSQNRLQYLRAADPSKAQIKIIDHEYFDVQNVSIKSYEEDQTILLDAFSAEKEGMITKQEFNNILSAYNDPARLFCEAKNKFVSYGVYVARNTNRYKCLSEDGKLEQELKSTSDLCKTMKRDFPKENINFPNECIMRRLEVSLGLLDSYNSFCKKYTTIASSNEMPSCDLFEQRYSEYQLVQKDRNLNNSPKNQKLAEELRNLDREKHNKEQVRNKERINLQVTNTQANSEGDFVINIQTGTDTASLKINGEEQGGKQDGIYSIKRIARAGLETKFTIVAKDTNGNTDSKTIAVTRQVTASSQIIYAELNPALVKTQPNKDAVAIIIGIADYKNLPRADFANDDARAFYDYAIRGLGVKAENIKLLVDADAGQEEIYKAFKTWLPARVRATTDVYVYYSGHGITTNDGQSLYLLPQRTDRDLIEETAIAQNKINAAIQAAKPKSVTIFLDSCYSGAGRTGQTLLASARPIAIKSTAQAFPAEFTVISASTAEQISSSSNELKHGIFSYYLMRGMEGEADTNKDGKITPGEMHTYLMDNVTRQASLANRVQQPQLSGDANRVLIGR